MHNLVISKLWELRQRICNVVISLALAHLPLQWGAFCTAGRRRHCSLYLHVAWGMSLYHIVSDLSAFPSTSCFTASSISRFSPGTAQRLTICSSVSKSHFVTHHNWCMLPAFHSNFWSLVPCTTFRSGRVQRMLLSAALLFPDILVTARNLVWKVRTFVW